MKGKDKNKRIEFSDLLRYADGKMTRSERNAFERKLQMDPFGDDAAEGLSEISPEEAAVDMGDLGKRLKIRTSHRQRFIYYRIAASIAVLMIISSVFIIVYKNKPAGEPDETVSVQAPIEIPESKGIKGPEETALRDEIATTEKRKTESTPEDISLERAEGISEKKYEPLNAAESVIQVQPAMEEVELMIAEDEIAAPVAAAPSKMIAYAKELNVNGIRPDTTLEEVVVVGYGVAQKSDNEGAGYSPPVPVEGKLQFEDYIRENIRNPGILKEGEKAVVVISFIVQSNGILDSIKIVKSPDSSFSDEALRLIREGAAWKPAIENGKAINDKVRIRFVFSNNDDYKQLPE
ncbi:MAG: TonB family protein [Bacteroidia bacterium]|nr:TonB family protein [Bacteroidia bacterium]